MLDSLKNVFPAKMAKMASCGLLAVMTIVFVVDVFVRHLFVPLQVNVIVMLLLWTVVLIHRVKIIAC